MPTRIRRVLLKEHPRIVEIRFSEHENRLRDLSRVTDMDYLWFSESPGIWVWDEDRQIPSFFAADVRDGTIALPSVGGYHSLVDWERVERLHPR